MSNMSYCRFTNTLRDLRDCRDALDEMRNPEKDLSPEEYDAAKQLLRVCRVLAEDYEDEFA